MWFLVFILLIAIAWLLWTLVENSNESLQQQKATLDELAGIRAALTPPSMPTTNAPVTSSPSPLQAHAEPININSASIASLVSLPGIGNALAKRIAAQRPYSHANELLEIKGINADLLAKLKPLIST